MGRPFPFYPPEPVEVTGDSGEKSVNTGGDSSGAPKKIGTFSNLLHDIAGTAYAVNSTTILIKGFNYDGTAPDAFFLGGTSGQPSKHGEVFLSKSLSVF